MPTIYLVLLETRFERTLIFPSTGIKYSIIVFYRSGPSDTITIKLYY